MSDPPSDMVTQIKDHQLVYYEEFTRLETIHTVVAPPELRGRIVVEVHDILEPDLKFYPRGAFNSN